MGSSRSVPGLGPAEGRGLYEVMSGAVMLRPEPHAHSTGLGAIRGGVKFFAVPEKIGNQTWLKLQTEHVTPPMFSPSRLGPPQENLGGLGPDMRGATVYKPEPGKAYRQHALAKGLHLYRDSVPRAMHQCDQTSLQSSANLWIRADERCVSKIRDAPHPWGYIEPADAQRAVQPPASDGAQNQALDFQIADYESRLDAKNREMVALSCSGPSADAKGITSPASLGGSHLAVQDTAHWASYGRGGWMNFGRYGVTGLPANDNCGRWRQLGSDSGWPVARATRDMFGR